MSGYRVVSGGSGECCWSSVLSGVGWWWLV